MEHVEQRPNSNRNTVGYYFPSFKRKMKAYDGGFHGGCSHGGLGLEATIPRQQRSQFKPTQRQQFSTYSYDWETVAIRHKPFKPGWINTGTFAATHTSRMESAVQASR